MGAKDSGNDDGKENGSNKDNSNNENERLLSSPLESPTLATRYAHRAATLVRSIEKMKMKYLHYPAALLVYVILTHQYYNIILALLT
jgi:hypothetical protein